MQTNMQSMAAEHSQKINKLIDEFEKGDQSGIQAFGAQLREIVTNAGLAAKVRIHHSQLCPHEDNRDGELLIPIAVWQLLLKISRKGWSSIECSLALSCGIPPNDVGERWKAKAMRLHARSDGLLPPYAPELLTAATAAGSHTTAVLRLLDWAEKVKVPCPDDAYNELCEGGFLSTPKIVAKQPSFKAPLQDGIEYTHIRWELVAMVPQLMRVLSQSDNAKHTVFCRESPMQTMLAIHRRAVTQGAKSTKDWNKIAEACARGLGTEFIADVKAQAMFVEKLSGGVDGAYLKDLDSYWKTLRLQRNLDPEFLKSIASSGNWVVKGPRIRHRPRKSDALCACQLRDGWDGALVSHV